MNRIVVSGVAAIALLAGSLASADNGGPATTSFQGTGSGVSEPSADNGTPGSDSTADNRSGSADDAEMKACLVRKKSGDHSMSRTDREKACRAEAEENAVQPVASVRGR